MADSLLRRMSLLMAGGLAVVVVVGCSSDIAVETNAGETSTSVESVDEPSTTVAVESGEVLVTSTVAPTTTSTTSLPPGPEDDGLRSDERRLIELFQVTNADLKPKSVVVGPRGLVFAQNMMYRHNVLVFDQDGDVVAKIDDSVDLQVFGLSEDPQLVKGAPVEAAVSPDGQHLWVSNYKMYGDRYQSNADDECGRGDWEDSFVYRINLNTFDIDGVVPTGAVPKFLQVSPDGRRLVVANWCGFDVSVIDTERLIELGRVDLGRHPRGVAITNDSSKAYVTVMGAERIDLVDLETLTVESSLTSSGITPRHIVLSDDGKTLFSSNHLMDTVRSIDLETDSLIGTVRTGIQTRSLAVSDDETALYVVNYLDGTISKVRTSDMEILQTISVGGRPVGI
ncbi:MAG: YncE family protein, partial [Actinobacteria bacterium]|nr:YncE family protein [Actinomycetota bacterium]